MIKNIFLAATISLLGIVGLAKASADKVLICHQTGSEKNPVVIISVSSRAEQAHLNHGDTLLPAGENDCSGGGGPLPE